MNIVLIGAAGFIGTNLALTLAQNDKNKITLVDRKAEYFDHIKKKGYKNIFYKESILDNYTNFDMLLKDQEVVYHLVSTTIPTTSNQHIPEELNSNVIFSSLLFEACVRCNVKKVIFISSGGTVYGRETVCPIPEQVETKPISSYGLQKIMIEKLLELYNYMYGLDYRIVRLSNPYGPYQRPNGMLGAVTTFTYKALMNQKIEVYGDGSVVRDYIYIDDAIMGIIKIASRDDDQYKTYNLGSGQGTSVNDVIRTIKEALNINLQVQYTKSRKVDVPINYLDISRYESIHGKLNLVDLRTGIKKTADFMKNYYEIN